MNSAIVWVLVISTNFNFPAINIVFDTETECEKVKKNVVNIKKTFQLECIPKRKSQMDNILLKNI